VETDALGPREAPRERPEARKGGTRATLVEADDGGGDLRFGVSWREGRGCVVLAPCRQRTAEPLEREPVEELGLDVPPECPAPEEGELPRGREAQERLWRREARDEKRPAPREVRVEEVVSSHRRGRVRLDGRGGTPCFDSRSVAARPEAGEAEVQLHEGVTRMPRGELLQALQARVRPAGEQVSDACLDRVVASEDPLRLLAAVRGVEALGATQGDCLRVCANPELEDEGRHALPRPSPTPVLVAAGDHRERDRSGSGEQGQNGHEYDHARAGAHVLRP
jgi:hypothetical protein